MNRRQFVADIERALKPLAGCTHPELTANELETFRNFVSSYVDIAARLDAERARLNASLADLAKIRGAK